MRKVLSRLGLFSIFLSIIFGLPGVFADEMPESVQCSVISENENASLYLHFIHNGEEVGKQVVDGENMRFLAFCQAGEDYAGLFVDDGKAALYVRLFTSDFSEENGFYINDAVDAGSLSSDNTCLFYDRGYLYAGYTCSSSESFYGTEKVRVFELSSKQLAGEYYRLYDLSTYGFMDPGFYSEGGRVFYVSMNQTEGYFSLHDVTYGGGSGFSGSSESVCISGNASRYADIKGKLNEATLVYYSVTADTDDTESESTEMEESLPAEETDEENTEMSGISEASDELTEDSSEVSEYDDPEYETDPVDTSEYTYSEDTLASESTEDTVSSSETENEISEEVISEGPFENETASQEEEAAETDEEVHSEEVSDKAALNETTVDTLYELPEESDKPYVGETDLPEEFSSEE